MRINNGRYECAFCGATLDIPLVADPTVTIKAASGAPNTRTLSLDGKVLHECSISEAAGADEKSTL